MFGNEIINKNINIYEKIQSSVENAMCSVQESLDDGENQDIIDNLDRLNDEIQKEYNYLKEVSEWKKFTIALYGVTNAGKSTLIEALRLYLKEETKLNSQKEFSRFKEEKSITKNSFEEECNIKREIEEIKIKIQDAEKNFEREYLDKVTLVSSLDNKVQGFSEKIDNIKMPPSLCGKILYLFRYIYLKIFLEISKKKLEPEKRELNILRNNSELGLLERKQEELLQKQCELKEILDTLKGYADGAIVGDGSPDFTKENQSFDFKIGDQEFTLIDVPGIEGNESEVESEIMNATKKAHAVFFVTKDKKIETGGEDKKGTLEKIKSHLSDHTEVWMILNQPTPSPRSLEKSLTDENDKGLKDLNDKLKDILSEQYKGYFVLSAYPAFLALAKAILPNDTRLENNKKKFLDKWDEHQLLELSRVVFFVEEIKNNIIRNYKQKIKESNNKKAHKTLERTINYFHEILNSMKEKEKSVNVEMDSAKRKVNNEIYSFSKELHSELSKKSRKMQDEIREIVYKKIDEDIDNDDVKCYLEETIESHILSFEEELKLVAEDKMQLLANRIAKIIDRSVGNLETIINQGSFFISKDSSKITFNLNLSDRDYKGLVGGGIGLAVAIAALVVNPVGWSLAFIAGVLGLFGALLNVGKAIWAFFDSEYKKSEQRKNVDKVLYKINGELETKLKKTSEFFRTEIEKQIGEILEKIENKLPLAIHAIEISAQELLKISNQFKSEKL